MIVSLQLKINNAYNEINALKKIIINKVMLICNDDKEFFRKCIEYGIRLLN